MSSIQPYRPSAAMNRTSRALQRLGHDTTLAVAAIESRADIEVARVSAIAAVAGRALMDVSLLSQMEQSLAQVVPHASGRLATIADLAALSMADVVASAAHRLNSR